MSKIGKVSDDMKKFDAMLKHQTEKAWLLVIGDDAYWVPKSICKWVPEMPDSEVGTVMLPAWYIKQNDVGITSS